MQALTEIARMLLMRMATMLPVSLQQHLRARRFDAELATARNHSFQPRTEDGVRIELESRSSTI